MMVTSTIRDRRTEQALAAVLWAAANKVANKELERDCLPEGDSRQVRLMITGEIDGHTIRRSLHGTLKVGADQERAVSVTPDQPTLVALILSKLNEATRNKILSELPAQFSDQSTWPDVSPDLVESAEQMLRDIRARKTVKVRGNVRFTYDIAKQARKPAPGRRASRNGRRATSSRCHDTRHCAK